MQTYSIQGSSALKVAGKQLQLKRGNFHQQPDKQQISIVPVIAPDRLLADIRPSQLVKTWTIHHGGKVELVIDPDKGLEATVTKDGKVTKIAKEWIDGIPKEFQKDPIKLRKYLSDTYVRPSPFEDGGLKLYVNHRLRGGNSGNATNLQIAAGIVGGVIAFSLPYVFLGCMACIPLTYILCIAIFKGPDAGVHALGDLCEGMEEERENGPQYTGTGIAF